MPREPTYVRNLKTFARGTMTMADLPKIEAELYGASDRATAVMLGSSVEAVLTGLIVSFMRPKLSSDDFRTLFDSAGDHSARSHPRRLLRTP